MNPYGIKVESQSLARGQADKAQKCPSFFVGGWWGCIVCVIGECYEITQN